MDFVSDDGAPSAVRMFEHTEGEWPCSFVVVSPGTGGAPSVAGNGTRGFVALVGSKLELRNGRGDAAVTTALADVQGGLALPPLVRVLRVRLTTCVAALKSAPNSTLQLRCGAGVEVELVFQTPAQARSFTDTLKRLLEARSVAAERVDGTASATGGTVTTDARGLQHVVYSTMGVTQLVSVEVLSPTM